MSEIEKIMAEAAEKVRREGYAAGWRDAVAAITKAVTEARPGDIPDASVDALQSSGLGSNGSAGPLPAVGTIPHYVLAVVKRRPGSTGAEIIGALGEEGHKFAEPQIRTNLKRLEDKNLIVNRHKKWFAK